jgi:hypothetical protein
MSFDPRAFTITPSSDAIAELKREWSWLLPLQYEAVLFSALGDLFYETSLGEIWWLNTGTAELSKVAEDSRSFERHLGTDASANWFLPPLIEKLVKAGKTLGEGQCYTFVTLPIFKEGTYTVENLNPVNAKEHFGSTGSLHRQVRGLPDGAKVRIKIT